ncbi:MAG TPA: L-threonylcarbamoyladenylate synthase [Candidatus Hodarchaeales archaeon]|nr:L-threonylcarbamoyladenylate synthase [Candidatus Hodarchaeales archaeon]
MTIILPYQPGLNTDQLTEAARLICEGELVAFPTETVYGLGADALRPEAVKRIFEVKGRPNDNPIIVHVRTFIDFCDLIDRTSPSVKEIIDKAELLSKMFWPGPLTLIVPKGKEIPLMVTGGLETVAIRIPSHPAALELLQASSRPIAAPSANISGSPSPTTVEDVIEDLYGRVPLIIDGGPCSIGLESTVLDLTSTPPQILRPGGISGEQISEIIGEVKLSGDVLVTPKSPGMKYRHYSPKAVIEIAYGSKEEIYEQMKRRTKQLHKKGVKVGIIALRKVNDVHVDYERVIGGHNQEELLYMASILFHEFREMDRRGIRVIMVEAVERKGIGVAIMNRLERAGIPLQSNSSN